MNLAAFPKRPLALAESTGTTRRVIMFLFCSLFFAGCFLVFLLALGPGILEDVQLAREGAPASSGRVSGELRSRLFTNWGDLKLEYTIPGNGQKVGFTSFDRNKDIFFVGNLDDSKEPVIYYLRSNPSVATVSYALDLLLNREITLAVSLVLELAFVVAGIWACFRTVKIGHSLRLAADNPEPSEVTITRDRLYRSKRYISYTWENGRTRRGTVTWKKDREPLFSGPIRDRALAVKGPDGYAHLLDSDFRPFQLTEAEKAQVLQ